MIPEIHTIVATYMDPLQLLSTHDILHIIKFSYNASEFVMTPSTINYIFDHFPNIIITGLNINLYNEFFKKKHKYASEGECQPSHITKSLHKLKIIKSDYHLDVDAFMTQCPNIRSLDIDDYSFVFSYNNIAYKNLRSLHIASSNTYIRVQHKFPNLHHLHIKSYEQRITQPCITLRSLTITHYSKCTIDDFKFCKSLKILKLYNSTISISALKHLKLKLLILCNCKNSDDGSSIKYYKNKIISS